jgi:Mg-chelatase subunit ChlD
MPMLDDYEAGSFEVLLTDFRVNAAGVTESQDAAAAAALLRSFAKRRTPVLLIDQTGETYLVKITKLSRRIVNFSGGSLSKGSSDELVYTLNFVEVD